MLINEVMLLLIAERSTVFRGGGPALTRPHAARQAHEQSGNDAKSFQLGYSLRY